MRLQFIKIILGVISILIGETFSGLFCIAFLYPKNNGAVNFRRSASTIYESQVDGLVDDFDKLCEIDSTLHALKEQLPLTLTKPLTSISASKVYSKDVRLTVVIPRNENEDDGRKRNVSDNNSNDDDDDDITLFQSRDELVKLSDVLVVATSAARQANSVLSGTAGSSIAATAEPPSQVKCQLIIDQSVKAIRVPWKTSIPIFGRIGPNNNDNRIEGISELVLDEDSGKINIHRILNVTFNGLAVNGPAIGQTLRTIQSASSNVQQSPLIQGWFSPPGGGGNTQQQQSNPFNDLRDGILEQVATSLSSSMPPSKEPPMIPTVYSVSSLKKIKGWMDTTGNSSSILQPKSRRLVPCPGSDDWPEYVLAHDCLLQFYDDVLPRLPEDGTVNPNDFTSNVTLTGTDDNLLLQGNNAVADFYQSIALARKNTAGSWTLKRCSLVDWKKRSVAIEYKATNNIPPCTITGRDIYSLVTTESRPIVKRIKQMELSVISSDSSLSLDSQWIMKNLVNAVEGGRLATGSSARDVFSELIFQQVKRIGQTSSSSIESKKRRLSQSAAATAYYIMSDLHEFSKALFNETTSLDVLPPVADFMTDDVELRGYLGETFIRGASFYNRAVSSFLSNIQQSIIQKRLVVEKTVPPRVELLANGDIRFYQIFYFRLPPPGASIFLPDSKTAGVPLKVELMSDYKINAETGRIYQHSLVETRINGQLTPGDVISRTVRGFLNPQERSTSQPNGEDMLKTFSDIRNLIQKITESGR